MIKFEYEGREFEFMGRYEIVLENDYFLPCNQVGAVSKATHGDAMTHMTRAIVHPVEKYHDFGGIRFKETGEVRKPLQNDWYLDGYGMPEYVDGSENGLSGMANRTILEPVQIL